LVFLEDTFPPGDKKIQETRNPLARAVIIILGKKKGADALSVCP
jgi:hypothetical protein